MNVWKTKEGELIKFEDMEDSHILNSIAMLERSVLSQEQHLNRTKDTISKLQLEKLRRLNVKKYEAKLKKEKPAITSMPKVTIKTGRKFKEN